MPAPPAVTYTMPSRVESTVSPIGTFLETLPRWMASVRSYTWLWPLMTRSTWCFSNSGTHASRTPPSEACELVVEKAQWWKKTTMKSMPRCARS